MIVAIKHIDIEGLETLGDFFERKNKDVTIIDLEKKDIFPDDISEVEAVINLGGPMNVYEEKEYPFLKKEDVFVKRIVANGIPYLGLCLGAQILAKACGAVVKKSPEKEIGFYDIDLTPAGVQDEIFTGLSHSFSVFQWHEDMFTIPQGAQCLASSVACPHQAFRFGPCAYGLQFHVEISKKSIEEWTCEYIKDAEEKKNMKLKMINSYSDMEEEFCKTAEKIYTNFLEIIRKHNNL